MGHKEKLWAVALLVGIIIVLSSVAGTLLAQKEVSTGGMDVLWKQTNVGSNHDRNVYWINDSALINDISDQELRCLGSDGSVAWSYPYMGMDMLIAQNGHICFVENKDGIKLTCLDYNGSLKWTLPDPWANVASSFPGSETYGMPGADGNTYLFSSTACSVWCIGTSGQQKWTFTVDNGVIGSPIIYPDGTVLVAHIITNASSLNSGHPQLGNGEEIIGEELVCISSNGSVVDTLEIPDLQSDLRYTFEQATNGTAIIRTYDFANSTSNVIGLSDHLQIMWSVQDVDLNDPVQGTGSVIYYLEHRSEVIDAYGGIQHFTTLCAYSNSNGSFLYRTDFSGSFSGGLFVNGDTTFLNENDKMWIVGPDGQARSVGTSGWIIYGAYEDGLLLYDDIGFKLIGADGSTEWQYDLDSGVIQSMHVASDGTIMVWANDGLTAFHKPTMSNNMMYIVGLVAFDLLVVLTAGIWIMDHRSPKGRKTP
jgi:hypothetical protein